MCGDAQALTSRLSLTWNSSAHRGVSIDRGAVRPTA
jgi:hypothetical protein